MAVQRDIDYEIFYGDVELTGGLSVFSNEFDEAYAYDGEDLGCTYTPDQTSFCLWAPTASDAAVVLYETWDGAQLREVPMSRGERGVWRVAIPGDWKLKLYTYKVKISGQWNEAVDPYAKAVEVNGDRGAIVDLSESNPERWTEDRPAFEHPVDAIIYEVHVRDLTKHPHSGATHKGTYLGACEKGTVSPQGLPTGIDHIKSLGVTHVQFLPIYDYSTESVDETDPEASYNWGYDPKNYNAPEGSYSTDPYDPVCRIRELKTMIQAYQDNGMRVIMDVVFNHVYDAFRMSFTKLVPGYYFRYTEDRTLSNGSACGNDTASERAMMRKFIVDSVLYWAKEYRLDGFRFDLMGLHDVETMNEVRQRLNELDPSIVVIGEGWKLATELPDERLANQSNAASLPGIGHFNDQVRDTVKGSVFEEEDAGFIGGKPGIEQEMLTALTGGIPFSEHIQAFAQEPAQSVAYAEAHDNHTMWDKLVLACPDDSEEVRRRRHMLGSAIVLTCQGIAFIHAGQEFMRTKGGVENSYKSPDTVNWMDWDRCGEYAEGVKHIQSLIALRKKHPAFRLRTAEEIRSHFVVEAAPEGCVAFTLRNHAGGDAAKHLLVIHNASAHSAEVGIPLSGAWKVEFGADSVELLDLNGEQVMVQGISTVVLACYEE